MLKVHFQESYFSGTPPTHHKMCVFVMFNIRFHPNRNQFGRVEPQLKILTILTYALQNSNFTFSNIVPQKFSPTFHSYLSHSINCIILDLLKLLSFGFLPQFVLCIKSLLTRKCLYPPDGLPLLRLAFRSASPAFVLGFREEKGATCISVRSLLLKWEARAQASQNL